MPSNIGISESAGTGWCMSEAFFFNETATTKIYTLSLHDALPISSHSSRRRCPGRRTGPPVFGSCCAQSPRSEEHTSELQSHVISYAVFCLKKKKKKNSNIYLSKKKKKKTKNNKHNIKT